MANEVKVELLEIRQRDLNGELISEHAAFRLIMGEESLLDEGFVSIAQIISCIEKKGGIIPFLLERSDGGDDLIHRALVDNMHEHQEGMYVGDQWWTWDDLKPQWEKAFN